MRRSGGESYQPAADLDDDGDAHCGDGADGPGSRAGSIEPFGVGEVDPRRADVVAVAHVVGDAGGVFVVGSFDALLAPMAWVV